MKKAKLFFSLTITMFLLGLVEAVSGFVLWLALPTGGGGGGFGRHGGGGGVGELTFWGITRHTWLDIHDWVAIGLIVVVSIHIIMHWKWIVRMIKRFFMQSAEYQQRIRRYSSPTAGMDAALVHSEEKGSDRRGVRERS